MGRQCTEGMAGSPYSTQWWCRLLEYCEVTLGVQGWTARGSGEVLSLLIRTMQGKSGDGEIGGKCKPIGVKEGSRCLGVGTQGMPEVVEGEWRRGLETEA